MNGRLHNNRNINDSEERRLVEEKKKSSSLREGKEMA